MYAHNDTIYTRLISVHHITLTVSARQCSDAKDPIFYVSTLIVTQSSLQAIWEYSTNGIISYRSGGKIYAASCALFKCLWGHCWTRRDDGHSSKSAHNDIFSGLDDGDFVGH